MRKWTRVILCSAGLLVVVGVGVGGAEYVRLRRTPDWYAPDEATTAEQRATAAGRVEDVLARLTHWSALRHARGRPAVAAPAVADPANDDPLPLQFTDSQLNAFYEKWILLGDRRAIVERYVHEPRIAIRDGHLIVAAQVRDLGVVVSLFLDPSVSPTDGRVRLTLAKVMAGTVEVPDAFTADRRASLERALARTLPANQARAALTPDGLANGPAATAAMTELLLAVLRGRSAEPVLFVPVRPASSSPLLPVRITAVSARDHTLGMTAQAVPPGERPKLLQAIRRPDEPAEE